MKAELITVTLPLHRREMSEAVKTFRKNCKEQIPWKLITERDNLLSKVVYDDAVWIGMEYICPGGLVENGYARQQIAKLNAHKASGAELLIFVDDDVRALKPWGVETFLSNDLPIMFFQKTSSHVWAHGQSAVFGKFPDRRWQLKLPFAVLRKTLVEFRNSIYYKRAHDLYAQGKLVTSEWNLLAEFAMRKGQCAARNWDVSKTHWTLDEKIFEDHERQREKYLALLSQEDSLTKK